VTKDFLKKEFAEKFYFSSNASILSVNCSICCFKISLKGKTI
jgi:hypothetical protein